MPKGFLQCGLKRLSMPVRGVNRPTVAVVGAGFSGLLTALHLLRDEDGPQVRLIERRTAFGRGAAYSSTSEEHLLNVRAANMSAFPEQPDHFIDWLAKAGDAKRGASFVTRAQYGAYLQAMLREATETSAAGRLLLEADAAVELRPEGEGWIVKLAMGRTFPADIVALAVGNLPPHLPAGVNEGAATSPAYFGDPWTAEFDSLPQEGVVVLVGTGLTMVDLALRLARERPGLTMLALSRRGLQPRRHLPQGPAPEPFTPTAEDTSRRLLRTMRARARTLDWRSLVDGLRPHVQTTWGNWPVEERSRFLRHLRPWWDIHRHRLAPEVASKLDHLTASGALTIVAGRIASVQAHGDTLKVAWAPRGETVEREVAAVGVINCTGPEGDLTRVADPLLSGLFSSGRIRADACRLGLDVRADGRLTTRDGATNATLYAVGLMTCGALWEITSVPDIRVQAAQCARTILQRHCAPVVDGHDAAHLGEAAPSRA